jgi:hypothetical protein
MWLVVSFGLFFEDNPGGWQTRPLHMCGIAVGDNGVARRRRCGFALLGTMVPCFPVVKPRFTTNGKNTWRMPRVPYCCCCRCHEEKMKRNSSQMTELTTPTTITYDMMLITLNAPPRLLVFIHKPIAQSMHSTW